MQRSIKVQLTKNALFICTPGWTKSLLIQGKSWSESVAPPPRGSPHRLPARHIYLRWERQPEATAVRHFGWSPKQQPRVIPPVGRLFCNLLLSCSHNISNRTLICDQSSEESSAHLLKSLSSDDQKAWEIFQKVWISKTSPKQTKKNTTNHWQCVDCSAASAASSCLVPMEIPFFPSTFSISTQPPSSLPQLPTTHKSCHSGFTSVLREEHTHTVCVQNPPGDYACKLGWQDWDGQGGPALDCYKF